MQRRGLPAADRGRTADSCPDTGPALARARRRGRAGPHRPGPVGAVRRLGCGCGRVARTSPLLVLLWAGGAREYALHSRHPLTLTADPPCLPPRCVHRIPQPFPLSMWVRTRVRRRVGRGGGGGRAYCGAGACSIPRCTRCGRACRTQCGAAIHLPPERLSGCDEWSKKIIAIVAEWRLLVYKHSSRLATVFSILVCSSEPLSLLSARINRDRTHLYNARTRIGIEFVKFIIAVIGYY
jgi:hypothetical protein